MTDRQTYVDLFERHADWHDDLAWIPVETAADLVVDLDDRPVHPVLAALHGAHANRPTEDELVGQDG